MLDGFAAPPGDRHPGVTGHRPRQLGREDTGPRTEGTDDLVVPPVVRRGRSEDSERALSAGPARRMEEAAGLRSSDLVVPVAPDTREDRSSGPGRARLLEGDR